MKIQQYKHLYYHRPNGNNYFLSEVLIPLFCPYFSNSFHCFLSIMLGYFNLFLPFVPNCNVPTVLCSAKDMSSWYHRYVWYLFSKQVTLCGITGKKNPSVPSCFISLISGQKRNYIVRRWVKSVWCLIYHWHSYIP